jgi:hypothetical protein
VKNKLNNQTKNRSNRRRCIAFFFLCRRGTKTQKETTRIKCKKKRETKKKQQTGVNNETKRYNDIVCDVLNRTIFKERARKKKKNKLFARTHTHT